MNTVKRAVIMAAGRGERMRPLTLTTPKPLVRVGGQRMIDSVITSLRRNGIEEIYVVVGYKKELFADLPAAYPGLTLIENPWYDTCNNISSLYAARAHLREAIILDGDQIIHDDGALAPAFERSGYNGVWTEDHTDEWLMTAENGIVTGCSRTGGSGGWRLYSVSRWTAADGERLRRHLELEFMEKKNRQVYWDDVPMFLHPEEYELGVRPMDPGAVTEIDSLEELAAADPSYEAYRKEKGYEE